MKIRKRITFRGCLTAYAIAMACIVLGLIFGPRVLLYYIRRDMTPAVRAEMDRFFDEPVELPKEWQIVDPFPQEVLEARNRLEQHWAAIEQSRSYEEWVDFHERLRQGDTLTDEDWERIGDILRQQQAFRQEVSALVEFAGYEFEAFPRYDSRYGFINFLAVLGAAKLLCLESYALARQQEWNEAFEPCLICLRMIRRHPASRMVTQLNAFATEEMVSKCVSDLAAECEDPQVLRALLVDMNRFDPRINFNLRSARLLVFAVAGLRYYAREGETVDLESVRPAAYFDRQVLSIEAGKQGKHGLPNGLGRYEMAKWIFRNDLPFSRAAGEYLYGLYVINSKHSAMTTRELLPESYYDLACLSVASRIYELETGSQIRGATDLVPALLPQKLIDPFTDKPYLWHAETNTFYSIGPDKTDQSAAVLYDPTNGTLSKGDVVMGE